MAKIERALFSVTDKRIVGFFARALREMGVEILTTGGTQRKLVACGVDVKAVKDHTGVPEFMDGRVKTLHPIIAGGILGLRENDGHIEDAKEHGIDWIDMIVCNLYQFVKALKDPNTKLEDVLEAIDIGGTVLLRAAVKNYKDVVAIVDPEDYERVIGEMKCNNGEIGEKTRQELAVKVMEVLTLDSLAIWQFLAKEFAITEVVGLIGVLDRELGKAENPDQNPAHLFRMLTHNIDDPLAMTELIQVSDKMGPSYTNVCDMSRAIQTACRLAEAFRRYRGKVPYIVLICKHGNPCGGAISWISPEDALAKAQIGDPRAGMGGEVLCNFVITEELGNQLFESDACGRLDEDKTWGYDIIVAVDFVSEAIELLGNRAKRKLMKNAALAHLQMETSEFMYALLRGSIARQKFPRFILEFDSVVSHTGEVLTNEQWETLLLAWAICWESNSNTIALALDGMLIGLGVNQQDRVTCCRLALFRADEAGHEVKGAIVASDGFYMPDGPPVLFEAGCIGGIVPYDGKYIDEVVTFFEQKEMQVVFVDKKHRGFSGHGRS